MNSTCMVFKFSLLYVYIYAIINYLRKGPVCDDSSGIPVGQVACRNLGATLITITYSNTGPTNSMYIFIYTYIYIYIYLF